MLFSSDWKVEAYSLHLPETAVGGFEHGGGERDKREAGSEPLGQVPVC